MRTFGRNFWSDCDVGRLLFQSRWNLSEQKKSKKRCKINNYEILEIAWSNFKANTNFLLSSFTVELKTTLTRIKRDWNETPNYCVTRFGMQIKRTRSFLKKNKIKLTEWCEWITNWPLFSQAAVLLIIIAIRTFHLSWPEE